MKVNIEFDFDNYESKKAMNRILKSTDMAIVLFEIQNNLYKKMYRKLENSEYHWTAFEAIDETFIELRRLMEDNDINTDNLID